MLNGLTLDQIRTFVTVVDSGSFRSGAARLLRVQSAVSHTIANLELNWVCNCSTVPAIGPY